MFHLKNLRNFFIALVSNVGITAIYRKILNHHPLVRVIVFHDVQDSEWFNRVISYIHLRYNVLTPHDFREARFDPGRINVLITFDDGYESWTKICTPVLATKNIQAIFFINSGLIDAAQDSEKVSRYVKERLLLSPRNILTWEGVRTLIESGHTIGGHTTTHVRLSLLQEDTQQEEIVNDKKRIESMTQKELSFFAYPFGQTGDFNDVSKEVAAKAGYSYAFTTEGLFADMRALFTLPRLCLEDDSSLLKVRYWIEGGYDLYYKLKKLCVR